ncbi:hypothetical protein NUU61_004725 [Penicillium alfredii]|uniref:Uncharacterized protein n=1 Tax=Penicillium alfredii TaxID=1506179 RepID=A0A9W9K6Y0_9EURO|nr:uncharacterized protein NUU61_004725 [Penicillium alfredii]KAJ5095369.1 hypothetical protein NUU61_004725 [Penicillium alfredii]
MGHGSSPSNVGGIRWLAGLDIPSAVNIGRLPDEDDAPEPGGVENLSLPRMSRNESISPVE